jgi:hypothetical protein
MMPLAHLLSVYRPGSDDHDWQTEFDQVEQFDWFDGLMTSIQETGIQNPILLGADGRVWDGHHRITAAFKLGVAAVPVEFRTD